MTSEDITDDQIASWLGMLERPPYCFSPRTPNMEHQGIAGLGIVFRAGCNSWSCPGCSDRRRLEWGVSLARHFLKSRQFIAEESCPFDAWNPFRYHLAREGAEYARVEIANEWRVFYTSKYACDAPTFTDTVEAIERLGDVLRLMVIRYRNDECRPITSSRKWPLPKRAPSDYKRAGFLPVADQAKLRKLLEEAGAEMKEMPSDGGREWSVRYKLPDGKKLCQ